MTDNATPMPGTDTPKLPIQERLRQQADAMFFPDCLEPCTMREAAEAIGELVEALSRSVRAMNDLDTGIGVHNSRAIDRHVPIEGDVVTAFQEARNHALAILAKVQP